MGKEISVQILSSHFQSKFNSVKQKCSFVTLASNITEEINANLFIYYSFLIATYLNPTDSFTIGKSKARLSFLVVLSLQSMDIFREEKENQNNVAYQVLKIYLISKVK